MDSLTQFKTVIVSPVIAVVLACFGLLPKVQAVSPPPDGGYAGGNTAEGQLALGSLTSGIYNTAVGIYSLLNLTTGNHCTGVGAGTLLSNTADENTANGAGALFSNTSGAFNTANGAFALFLNTTASNNTATGAGALQKNATGETNVANGSLALGENTTGSSNVALGFQTMLNTTSGNANTAVGTGAGALIIAGNGNVCIGFDAGNAISNENNNVCIGEGVVGEVGVSDSTYIRNINTTAQPIVMGVDGVTVDLTTGKLGHGVSSRRFKEQIKPMDEASEALYQLNPVTFHYKKAIDPTQTLDYGLIAEEVAAVNPELAVRDREGKISNYRRDAVNAMLLNEFLKEHRKVEEQNSKIQQQEATISELRSTVAQQQKGLQAVTARLEQQAAQIQKVSAQLEATQPASQLVNNNP